MRFATLGNVYAWEFEKGSREVNVKVEGQLTVNDIAVIRQAALNGVGIAFVPEDIARLDIESWQTGACARRLDAAIPRLLPVLSQPSPAIPRLRAARRSLALSWPLMSAVHPLQAFDWLLTPHDGEVSRCPFGSNSPR